MDEERRKEIWDDTLHFTVKGYDLIGKLLADRIVELVREEEQDSREPEPVKGELKKKNANIGGVTVQGKKVRSGRVILGQIEL